MALDAGCLGWKNKKESGNGNPFPEKILDRKEPRDYDRPIKILTLRGCVLCVKGADMVFCSVVSRGLLPLPHLFGGGNFLLGKKRKEGKIYE
jgi:hypothetical protein